ncbi:MAG: putative metal-dependent hydrolase [Bacteroidetes bacterium]|nr:putative metal-dependent hydrolase [Bacteroidota bacterium]
MEHLKYPIGRFDREKNDYSLEELLQFVIQIQSLPADLAKLLNGITPEQLQLSYRDGGWTVQQILHHLADSHMHAWMRTKFCLAEDNPVIKPYDENVWAAQPDYAFHYEASYILLVGLHQKWSLLLLECLKKPETLLRTFTHPQYGHTYTLAQLIAQYAWHGRQHTAHIQLALNS